MHYPHWLSLLRRSITRVFKLMISYEIEYSLDEVDWTPLDIVAENVEELEHSGLLTDTQYFYRIRSVDETESSEWVYADATTLDSAFKPYFANYNQVAV